MNLVLEGPDGSGKSTLAKYVSERLGWKVISSEGPEKYPGEILERVHRYGMLHDRIFDRHPVISQTIYSRFRPTNNTRIPTSVCQSFYANSILVYCYTDRVLPHLIKGHDTPEHLSMIEARKEEIRRAYYEWALEYADLIYRVGDDKELIFTSIRKALQICSTQSKM